MDPINLLNAIFVKPQLFEVYKFVKTANAPNFVASKIQFFEERKTIELPYDFDVVRSQPHFLQSLAPIDPFNLVDALIYKGQLFQVGEVYQPVYAHDVVQAEVNHLN